MYAIRSYYAIAGNFLESGALKPLAASADTACAQLYGDVWEWTASAYAPYPGFKPLAGSLGEYNGKFMCNQLVVRGGSCVTQRDHMRASYRSFFYPHDRCRITSYNVCYTKLLRNASSSRAACACSTRPRR